MDSSVSPAQIGEFVKMLTCVLAAIGTAIVGFWKILSSHAAESRTHEVQLAERYEKAINRMDDTIRTTVNPLVIVVGALQVEVSELRYLHTGTPGSKERPALRAPKQDR